MHTVTLTEVKNHHGEVFDRAREQPVAVTRNRRASHVILSARTYEQMVERLSLLEDRLWAEAAQENEKNHVRLGSESFTAALESLSRGK
jgi:prevent-host-death family protein